MKALLTVEPITLDGYLKELEHSAKEKPEQVREGLEIYVGLWRKAVERGVVGLTDDIGSALEKVERAGGLYKAAEE